MKLVNRKEIATCGLAGKNKPLTVVWLSKHEMSFSQDEDLQANIHAIGGKEEVRLSYSPVFPPDMGEFWHYIKALFGDTCGNDKVVVCGNFPAHTVPKIMEVCDEKRWLLALPVSVEAMPRPGERVGGGFVHNNWDLYLPGTDKSFI